MIIRPNNYEKMAASRRVDLCSLPLQATLCAHAWYVPLFVVLELGCLVFKGKPTVGFGCRNCGFYRQGPIICSGLAAVLTLPYPAVRNAWPELALLLALGAIEAARLFLGERTRNAHSLRCRGFHLYVIASILLIQVARGT